MRFIFGFALLIVSLMVSAAGENLNIETNSDQFTVSLPANPTTGYRWYLNHFDNTIFKMIDSVYESPKTNRLGAGGTRVYTFQLKEGQCYPKTSKMIFQYARPWEKEKGSQKEINLNFETCCQCHSL